MGWWAGFGLAGIGMAAGLVVFLLGKPLLQGKGEPPDPVALKKPPIGPLHTEGLIYILGLAGTGGGRGCWCSTTKRSGWMLAVGSIAVLSYIGWFMVAKCNRMQRERLGLAMILIVMDAASRSCA